MTCGVGYRTHWRECNDPKPSNGGKICEGAGMSQQECHEKPCPSRFSFIVLYNKFNFNFALPLQAIYSEI